MRPLAARTGLLLLPLLCATPLAGQRSDRRTIGAAAIAAAGWHRLGDIASALPPGATASIDGFNHELTAGRLGFHETTQATPTWRVRLNGQDVPTHIGRLWLLDAIPVAITQLDSIVISERPAIVDGHAAFVGTIDLFTRRPRRGISAVADYQHGDETGDPGPYRYTARSTPNSEKVGPFASGAVAGATSGAALDVAARYASLNVTDERLTSRLTLPFPTLQKDVNASGGSGVATVDALRGTHFVVAGRGRFTGILFPPTVGSLQSARVVTSHAGVSGAMSLGGRAHRYSFSATELDVRQLKETPAFVLEQQRVLADGFIETTIGPGMRLGGGLSVARQEAADSVAQRNTPRAWLAYAGHQTSAGIALSRFDGRLRASASARHERTVGDSDVVAFSASLLNAERAADHAWMDAPVAGGMTVGDVRAELTTNALLGMRPTWYARGFVHAGTAAVDRLQGAAVGFVATTVVDSRMTAWARAEVSQLFGEADRGERSTPSGFAEAAVSGNAGNGFSVGLSGRFAPATLWQRPPAISDEVPATRRVDLSLNKRLWHDRARAQIVMRNLLNAADRTHPDGAQWNLRTHIAITIALPSGAAR